MEHELRERLEPCLKGEREREEGVGRSRRGKPEADWMVKNVLQYFHCLVMSWKSAYSLCGCWVNWVEVTCHRRKTFLHLSKLSQ